MPSRITVKAYDPAVMASAISPNGEGGPCPTCKGRGFLPPLRECANENCARWFRWQDGNAKGGRSDAKFCSALCARAQASRDLRRRRRKNPPDATP